MFERIAVTAVAILAASSHGLLGCAASSTDPDPGTSDGGSRGSLIDAAVTFPDASGPSPDSMPAADAPRSAADAAIQTPDSGPAWIHNGVAICPEAASYINAAVDSAVVMQSCIDRTPLGMALELSPGRYSLAAQLRIDRAITLRTRGRLGSDACAATASHGCAELMALPSFAASFGMFRVTASATIDHIVVNGNRQGRGGTASEQACASLNDNTRGFNATFDCTSCTLTESVSMNALCGTGLLVIGPGTSVTIKKSTFAYNGVHNVKNLWADGLTVLEAADATFTDNIFIDNTDIDLIFGGCPRCVIRRNAVIHSTNAAGGAFAAIMIQKWPGTSGNYADVDISGNTVDCGASRLCGSGLYIGSESWYAETPYGTLTEGATSGLITGNTIRNTMNAVYIAARGLAIYGNNFVAAHGVAIPNTCDRSLVSTTPIVVSPTTQSCHFNGENVEPSTSIHYSSADWSGCIPNWPF